MSRKYDATSYIHVHERTLDAHVMLFYIASDVGNRIRLAEELVGRGAGVTGMLTGR